MFFYAARQPIFTRTKELFAYELLFRDSLENVFPNIDGDEATAKLIEASQFNLGLGDFTDKHLAFINFSDELLIKKYPTLMPTDQLVVEILETARPTKSLLAAVKELKELGYTIALDDYVHNPVWLHFFPYIDIIKVDFKESNDEEIKNIIKVASKYPIKLLAEKVETYEEFNHALDSGFSYFQGYFFSEPEVMQSKALAPSQMSLAELLYESSKSEMDLESIIKIFERDVTLSFKLLRYANSAAFKRRGDIETIKQGLVVLGQAELKKFLAVLFTAQVNTSKPIELIRLSMSRANFCESIANSHGRLRDPSTAFLTGMMSVIDAILDEPIESIMEKLPLAEEIKNALMGKPGVLFDYLSLIQHYEKAEWDEANKIMQTHELNAEKVPDFYHKSIQWANEHAGEVSGE
ncbi:EAL and HDOD domain-containing protein [Catenovulum maritimum]|uniref:Diguanylate phosphodiesterase n=1 Tax=Catenovulum maritimum TaxID=1513271 RepID=A0A0J8GTA5_9ALTE|nr:HDOD domain-containing protein [Catenovulum maritimum]KMT63938.1 diguanylate phosphodiesterase [Catenovulum maritimum]